MLYEVITIKPFHSRGQLLFVNPAILLKLEEEKEEDESDNQMKLGF